MNASTQSHRVRAVLALALALATLVLPVACGKRPERQPTEEPPQAPTNRIAVPEAVRTNLGIRFATAERRRVAATLRLPGHFELLPHARHEHRAPFAGRVEVVVHPLQPVARGDVLYVLDAPAWREQQQALANAAIEAELVRAHRAALQPLLAAHQQHEQSLARALDVVEQRLRDLEATQRELGGQAQPLTDARVQQAQLQAQLAEAAEQHTDTASRLARLDADERALAARTELALAAAAAALGTTPAELARDDGGVPRWRAMGTIAVRAPATGVVDRVELSTGAWVDAHGLVVATIDPAQVRFRAMALQSDVAALRDGLPCAVTAASGAEPRPSVPGPLQLAASADPRTRTLEVFVVPAATAPFVRPGVAAFVEIETAGTDRPELAIPREAVLQDGLVRVYFRRDPKDRDQVIREEADLGVDDGRWIVVKSGLTDGDEVVTAGAYELVLASSQAAAKGGHFHADGTWHADDHK
jgi:hypothetical protein